MDEKHLESMSIPLGHKLKIMKKIKDTRKDKGMSVLESRQGQRDKVNNVDTQQKEFKKQEYSYLPEPNMASGGVGT